ncbi:dedicator of cytokinesis protein 1 [Anopheles sinensis]|uniref:Dedicator of cytokinesis protein 1 n=1 Tax=Anopheles sinensis TaxID=74873 RepID=A0A084W8W9_ANOSI|nr:dedicator of cytokinesis protein 1 [Anopheles sinensis]
MSDRKCTKEARVLFGNVALIEGKPTPLEIIAWVIPFRGSSVALGVLTITLVCSTASGKQTFLLIKNDLFTSPVDRCSLGDVPPPPKEENKTHSRRKTSRKHHRAAS